MIDMRFKELFFDAKAVTSRVDVATRRVLSRFGAFVRRTAKSSIRKRKRPAPPGNPPSSHTGLLKRFIFFGYEPRKRSVVIGPALLTQRGRGEAPSLLEYGGTASLKRRGRRRSVNYKPRPFMGPAMTKELPQLPSMWRNSLR